MQLFITEFKKDGEKIYIDEKRVIFQLKNVLRATFGYNFYLQDHENLDNKIRYKVELLEYKGKKCSCRILTQSNQKLKQIKFGMLIPLLNKASKHELIVQKLVEIGIPEIWFFKSDRSMLKELNKNKIARLSKIAIEAAEQSKSRVNPKIGFIQFLSDFVQNNNFIIFDENGINSKKINKINGANLFGIIGPEGGFTQRDIEKFGEKVVGLVGLGSNILRSETAAIIGGRLINDIGK